MNLLLEALTLLLGVAMGTGLAYLVLNGLMLVAFRRPQTSPENS